MAAAAAGADFLCYVTPSEHLSLPMIDDVREGVIASKIAGHCADLVKIKDVALKKDFKMAKARANLDWNTQYKLSINPERVKSMRERVKVKTEACSMCGDYCVYKIPSTKNRKYG